MGENVSPGGRGWALTLLLVRLTILSILLRADDPLAACTTEVETTAAAADSNATVAATAMANMR